VIVTVAGERIGSPDDVAATIQDRRPGETVEIEVRRDGALETFAVELTARPEQAP
jgi:S1-C subfamily serine protease